MFISLHQFNQITNCSLEIEFYVVYHFLAGFLVLGVIFANLRKSH